MIRTAPLVCRGDAATLVPALLLGLISHAGPAAAEEIERPEGLFVEAESIEKAAVYARVIDADDASGGQAVTSPEPWRPLFRYTLEPGDLPERVTVHVRRKHGPIQLKARVDGANQDLKWNWKKPAEFTWASLGTYNTADLGERIEIIRGNNADAPIVDAVVFADAGSAAAPRDATPPREAAAPRNANAPQNAGDVGITGGAAAGSGGLPPERPRAGLDPVDAVFSIGWSTPRGEVTAAHWGVAAYSLVDPRKADEPGFVAFLSALRPGLVRVHHAGMADLWSDAETRSWDVETIRRCLAPLAELPDAKLMVTFCGWPSWFSESKAIPPEKYDDAERLVRDWVRTVREASPVPVTHVEVFNEFDNTWAKAGRLDELWPFFARVVEAVRDEASGAKVGGPALTWANPEWVGGVLDAAGSRIDFLSWHGYAGGEPTTPNDKVLARAAAFAEQADAVARQLQRRGLDDVETYLNEYNVQWTWQPYERRHANAIGAALQASVIARLARRGVTGLAVWHAKGNAYGLIDEDNHLRATGQLFLLGRPMLTGTLADVADLPASDRLDVLPVTDERGRRSVMLVNLNEAPAVTPGVAALLDRPGPDAPAVTLHRIDAAGWTAVPADRGGASLSLPGWSVTVLTEHPAAGRFGTVALPGQHRGFDF